ncbi:hypothetical protein BT67DRAFT_140995 [Trichocladium antarcticum]|uniref:Uncharacterized protein n=1 Tax=Trichocladium antarcticum TaxID=1450529 RepID=A0AAN6UG33_9PEZI|nr:hypothetical protein BT67DRAFT_140995 [Trichocladium antarcticum]
MARFSVAFGRRKSTADSLENATATGPSFRVLERSEVVGVKAFDSSARLSTMTHSLHRPTRSDVTVDDNIFADLKSNRYVACCHRVRSRCSLSSHLPLFFRASLLITCSGSGSSNTTKTTLTDNSSRYSNTSTTPSSADMGGPDEWRGGQRKLHTDIPVPPIPKSSSSAFLKAAGRTFSFGGHKKHMPTPPTIDESPPTTPDTTSGNRRARAATSSTSTTMTPPRVDGDFDLGGDFGKMLLGHDKRASVATLRTDQYAMQAPAPRSLTASRPNQPMPIHIDTTTKVDPPPPSWTSQHSNDQLISSPSPSLSPPLRGNRPPPVPRHTSPLAEGKRTETSPRVGPKRPSLATGRSNSEQEQEEGEDEEAMLLRDSLSTVTRFLSGAGAPMPSNSPSVSRYRRDENMAEGDDDSLFDTNSGYSSRYRGRYATQQAGNPSGSHKVMTPAEFERYRKDKERQDKERERDMRNDRTPRDEDEDNYEDDEDDLEKAKQQAKQRRKQEAHMTVYRQQMMKVTGESANAPPSRPSLQMSFSTPVLPTATAGPDTSTANTSENSDEDEEIPLAVLAAHGFPARNRPPNRLSTMMSNPNLRASQQPSYQRPVSVVGDMPGPPGPPGPPNPRLPAFARKLPQDPFLGAGLVRNPVRESFALGGGAAAPGHPGTPPPPGGLIGVIVNEERSRALRRGSPHMDGPSLMPGAAGYDPVGGIPSQHMYQANPTPPMLSPGNQAQMHMNQQMQQFMQMQMQFMQMMAGQNGNPAAAPGGGMASPSGMPGAMGPDMRHSFIGNESMLDLPLGRGDAQMRTMSMVQPSSASWIQPALPAAGFAPSIRIQGGGYAPSIAPSERSVIGLPGRYRPVSHIAPAPPMAPGHLRKSTTMSGAIQQPTISVTQPGNASDDDDEEGWEAMKAKREKKKSMWRSKKSISDELGAFIS